MLDRLSVSPVLKWAGGKRHLAPKIKEVFDAYLVSVPEARLVDPFCGGFSVPFGVKPEKCLASDANPHLMNLYRWLQAGLTWDEDTGIRFENSSEAFYENRTKFNTLCASREFWTREGALLFYYLNKTGFNGLCRFNKSGYFNVPFGSYKNINYCKDLTVYRDSLEGWDLFYGDFATLPLKPTDFIYADPPYDVEFTQFHSRDFTWSDQERLAAFLANHPGPVLASNSSTVRIIELYSKQGFQVLKLDAPRRISCTGDRTPAEEILAYKAPL
jgi:DNA adenine methylase